MLCHICGAELDETTNVCPQCGAKPEDTIEDLQLELEQTAAEEIAEEPADDFDPRAFAGLDETMEFDPTALAAMALETEAAPAEAEAAEEEDAEEPQPKKEKKKMSPGAVTALIVAIVVLVLAACAGALYYLTMPVEEAVLAADFADFQNLPEEEKVTSLTINRRETQRFQRSDAVWCDITTETPAVRYDRSYLLSYELTKEGWKLFAVDNTATSSWDTAPLAGVSVEELQALLVGQPIEADEDFTYTLTDEDVSDVEILSQTTDLNGRTDQVEASITVTDDILAWTVNAQIGCSFDEGWQLDTLENAQAAVDFKPGMDFKLTQEDHLEDLYETPIVLGLPEEEEEDMMEVIVAGEPEEEATDAVEETDIIQEVAVTEETISNFSVEETAFRLEDSKHLVTCTFDLVKDIATLQVEAVMTYGHDGKTWEMEEVDYTATVKEVNLDGDWVGTYSENAERKPSVKLTFTTAEDGTQKGTFAFSPSEITPVFGTGSYAATAKVDLKTLTVTVTPGEWIANPYFEMAVVGLEGTLLIDAGVISDNESFSITLQRPEKTEE